MSLAPVELNIREVPLQRRNSAAAMSANPYAGSERTQEPSTFTVGNRAVPRFAVVSGVSTRQNSAEFFRSNIYSGGVALAPLSLEGTEQFTSVSGAQPVVAVSRSTADEVPYRELSPAVGVSALDRAPTSLPTEKIEVDSRRSSTSAANSDDDLHDEMNVDAPVHANTSRATELSAINESDISPSFRGASNIHTHNVEMQPPTSQQAPGRSRSPAEEVMSVNSRIAMAQVDERLSHRNHELVASRPSNTELLASPAIFMQSRPTDGNDDFENDVASPLLIATAEVQLARQEPTDGSTPTPPRITGSSSHEQANLSLSPGRKLELNFAGSHSLVQSPASALTTPAVARSALQPVGAAVTDTVVGQHGTIQDEEYPSPFAGQVKVTTSGQVITASPIDLREKSVAAEQQQIMQQLMMHNLEQQVQQLNERERRAGELLQSALEEGRRAAELQKANQHRELELAKKERDLMDQYKDFELRVEEWKLKEIELQRIAASKAEEAEKLLKFTKRLRLLTSQSRAATISGNVVRAELQAAYATPDTQAPYSAPAPPPVATPQAPQASTAASDEAAETKPTLNSRDESTYSSWLLGLIAFCFALSGAMFGILANRLGL